MKEGEGGIDFQVWSIPNLLQDLSSTGSRERVTMYIANQVTQGQPLTDGLPGYLGKHYYNIRTLKAVGEKDTCVQY